MSIRNTLKKIVRGLTPTPMHTDMLLEDVRFRVAALYEHSEKQQQQALELERQSIEIRQDADRIGADGTRAYRLAQRFEELLS